MLRPPILSGLLALAAAPAAAQTLTLPDIIVSANRTPTAADATGATVSVLTEGQLQDDGRPFILDQIGSLPGVSVQQNGPAGTVSGFTLRGAPQQYVRVMVDGIEISDPTAPQVSPSLSNLLTDDVSRVEVLQGSQSALYGGQAVAGVIDITTPRPTENGIENRLLLEGGSYSTFRGRYTLAGRVDRGDFAVSIANYQSDGFSAAEEGDGNSEKDGYNTTRLSASGTFYATDTVSLFGSAFWQTEDGDFDGETEGPPAATFDLPNTFTADSWGLRGGASFTALERLENTLALSWFNIDRKQNNQFGPYTSEGERARAEYLGGWRFSDALVLQFGADYTHETSDSNFSDKEANWIAGAFAQADWSPIEALTLNAALREDHHSEFGNYTTGRLTAAYALPTATVLRASLGNGFRAPSNFELFDPFSGNPDFKPETSLSADVGFEQGFFGGRGTATATYFWLQIDDLIEYDNATGIYFQTGGNSKSQGLELSAAYALTDVVTLSGTYTYTDARKPDGSRRDRVPLHVFNFGLDGNATDRVTLGLGLRYVSGYVDTAGPVDTCCFDEDYWVANARVAYALTDEAALYLRAENLFDEQYQTARGYSTSDRAFYFGVTGTF